MAERRRPLDRVNPAVRLLLAVVLSVPLLVTIDWLSAAVALVVQLVVFVVAGVSAGLLLRRLAPLLLVAPFTGVGMALYGRAGGTVWWQWGLASITDNSLRLALAMVLRIFALGVPAVALTAGVDATRTADGLAQVLRLPSRFVLGSLAGLRMLAVFRQDWRTLALARRARGLGDTGRVRRWATMSFALLVLAIRRGTRLATAMEAKGFGGSRERTWARESTVGVADLVALVVAAAISAGSLLAAWHFGTLLVVWQ